MLLKKKWFSGKEQMFLASKSRILMFLQKLPIYWKTRRLKKLIAIKTLKIATRIIQWSIIRMLLNLQQIRDKQILDHIDKKDQGGNVRRNSKWTFWRVFNNNYNLGKSCRFQKSTIITLMKIQITSLGITTIKMKWTNTSTMVSLRKHGSITQEMCFNWAVRCLICLNYGINSQNCKQMLFSRKTPISTSFSHISTVALTILIKLAQWMSLLK